MKRAEFLQLVAAYVESDPEVAPEVTVATQRGLSAALTESQFLCF